jgi:hypothetical protein
MFDENIDDILSNIVETDAMFIADIKRYWCVVTSYDNMEEMITAPIFKMKTVLPKVPDSEWDSIIKEYDIPAMEGEHVNMIMKYYTHEELKELLNEYENNPVLKKSLKKSIEMREESLDVSSKWLNRFNEILQNRIPTWQDKDYI